MWKKYLLLVYLFFLITGCFSKNKEIHIETIIEEKSHYKVSINYPKTGYSLLDDSLEKYIDNIYHFFIQNKKLILIILRTSFPAVPPYLLNSLFIMC